MRRVVMWSAFKEMIATADDRKIIILVACGEGVILLIALSAGVYFYMRT